MPNFFSHWLQRANDLAEAEPLLGLFAGAALLAVFLTALLQPSSAAAAGGAGAPLCWTLYHGALRLLWAGLLGVFLAAGASGLRGYLRETLQQFQSAHGRVTQANYSAVQTIWGSEQRQGELRVEIYRDEEITERIESEDLTKPALLRKRVVRRQATGNPFLAEEHAVVLRQNPRKKGSALYGGYETACAFHWKLRNPVAATQNANLIFPLPGSQAVFDGLVATFNGEDVLPQMQIKDGSLILARELAPGEVVDFRIAFASRGLAFWYFQITEAREIRDFTLALTLPDLPQRQLNYPGGCMTPTTVQPGPDGQGTVLTYRLDHALSNKGMGIALPELPQPGAATLAVLRETDRAWLLLFALLVLTLTLAGVRQAVLLAVLFSAGAAFGYGLLADFSDVLFGFWGTAAFILLPLFGLLAGLLLRVVPGRAGKLLAYLFLIFSVVYPCAAGFDAPRQALYLNLCGLLLLSTTAWLLVSRLESQRSGPEPLSAPPTKLAAV